MKVFENDNNVCLYFGKLIGDKIYFSCQNYVLEVVGGKRYLKKKFELK